MFIVSRLLPQSGKQPYVPQQVENPALWSRSMSQWTAGYPVGGPGSEHMVALSCACLATRGVEAVVICRRLVRPEASANCGYGEFLSACLVE